MNEFLLRLIEYAISIAIIALLVFLLTLPFSIDPFSIERKQMETTLVRALNDQVVLKPLKREAVSSGGIVLPDTARNSIGFARVFAVGRGQPVQGSANQFHTPECKVGDEVTYFINRSTPFRVSGEDFATIGSDDVLAIVTRQEAASSGSSK